MHMSPFSLPTYMSFCLQKMNKNERHPYFFSEHWSPMSKTDVLENNHEIGSFNIKLPYAIRNYIRKLQCFPPQAKYNLTDIQANALIFPVCPLMIFNCTRMIVNLMNSTYLRCRIWELNRHEGELTMIWYPRGLSQYTRRSRCLL